MKRFQIILSDASIHDMNAIFRTIALDSVAAAEKMDDKLTSAIVKLMRFSELGRPGRANGTRELVVAPYIVTYRVVSDKVTVLRVIHGRRNWSGKLPK